MLVTERLERLGSSSIIALEGLRTLEFTSKGAVVKLEFSDATEVTRAREVSVRAVSGFDLRLRGSAGHFPPETAGCYLQVAGGVSVAFSQISGRIVDVETWEVLADAMSAPFPCMLPSDYREAIVNVVPPLAGITLDLTDAPAFVDLDRGIWWTRSMETAEIGRIGDNIYLGFTDSIWPPIGLALTFPPAELANVFRKPKAGRGFSWFSFRRSRARNS